MKNKNQFQTSINWANIDLKSPYEASQNMLDPYSFDTLLIEIACNLPEINEKTVKAQAMESIKCKYQTAISILNDNLTNITKHAQTERAKK